LDSSIQQQATVKASRPENAWRRRAPDLADWAYRRLVNRTDAYGAYTPIERRGQPGRDGRPVPSTYTAKRALNSAALCRHFYGARHDHVLGLHSTSTGQTCRWGAFDVDRHGDDIDPQQTQAMSMWLYDDCVRRGFHPLLTTSNGRGGFHLRVLLREPVPCRDLHAMLGAIAQANGYIGEQYPKQAAIKDGGFGNWLRLPGRHHTRDHWSEVWDGSSWLSGEAAVEMLLTFDGDDPRLVPAAPPPPHPAVKATAPRPRHFGQSSAALEGRIAAYLARCPNKGEGEGRDDVAYRIACFLVRDVALPDGEALIWLSAWDRRNSPPKGDKRLREIITSAHAYGRAAYGTGLGRGLR